MRGASAHEGARAPHTGATHLHLVDLALLRLNLPLVARVLHDARRMSHLDVLLEDSLVHAGLADFLEVAVVDHIHGLQDIHHSSVKHTHLPSTFELAENRVQNGTGGGMAPTAEWHWRRNGTGDGMASTTSC